MRNVKVTYQNIEQLGVKISDSTHMEGNTVLPAAIFEVGESLYKKVYNSWLTKGKLWEVNELEQACN